MCYIIAFKGMTQSISIVANSVACVDRFQILMEQTLHHCLHGAALSGHPDGADLCKHT